MMTPRVATLLVCKIRGDSGVLLSFGDSMVDVSSSFSSGANGEVLPFMSVDTVLSV